MGDKEWKALYAPLSRVQMSDASRERILQVLRNEPVQAGGRVAARSATTARALRLRRAAWWVGTVAVAAALVAFAFLSAPGKPPGAPVQPAAPGPGPTAPNPGPTVPGPGTLPAVSEPLQSVQMLDAKVGWAAAQYGRVLRTEDGGATWVDVTPGDFPRAAPATTLMSPVFLPDDGQAAWLLNLDSLTVYRTTDGGLHWQKGTPPTPAIVNDGGAALTFTSRTQGWLLASTGAHQQGGQLFATTDGGLTWQPVAKSGDGGQSLPYGGTIAFSRSVAGLGWLQPNRMAAGGRPLPLYVTHDGGRSWAPLALPGVGPSQPASPADVQLPQFAARNIAKHGPATSGLEGILAVTGLSGNENTAQLYVTSDGGASWSPAGAIANVGSGMQQQVLAVADALTFWDYVPDGNSLWSTTDGGKSWSLVHPQPALFDPKPGPDGLLVTQLNFLSAAEGWAVVNGNLLHTTDGGRTWTHPSQP